MSNMQAVELIIKNIEYLEDAKKLLEGEISEKICAALDSKIHNFINDFEDKWEGVFDFFDNSYSQFSPEKWRATNGDSFKHQQFHARYFLGYESEETGGDSTEWFLTALLKNDKEKVVFNFYPWRDSFIKCTTKDWKDFANESNQIYHQIEEFGFKYNAKQGSWYLIIDGIDPQLLIENYENDTLEDALEPFEIALKKLQQAHPYFDAIVQAAKSKFNNEETMVV